MVIRTLRARILFDRPVEGCYIVPGGFALGNKNFDFTSSSVMPDPEDPCTAVCELQDYDRSYAEEMGSGEITEEDIREGFSEFFVYCGEEGDPDIVPMHVTGVEVVTEDGRCYGGGRLTKSADRALGY